MTKTRVGVFIIESTRPDEEESGLHEGPGLANLLRLVGVRSTYKYIRTAKELRVMLDEFIGSDYRYLHMSCHGDDTGFALTLEPDIPFRDFAAMLPKAVGKRRLFLSACGTGAPGLAKLLSHSPFMSVIGPQDLVGWSQSAAFWASFYHLTLRDDEADSARTSMGDESIRRTVKRLAALYGIKMSVHFFATNRRRVRSFTYPKSGESKR